MRVNPFFACLALCVAVASAGCGSQKGPPKLATVPVTGTVTYRNQPLADASVIFVAISGTVSSTGRTDAAGKYTLTTYGNREGAPAGKYKVLVAAVIAPKEVEPGVLAPEPEGGFKSPIPIKYSSVETTDLIVTVNDGPNDIPIVLK